MGDDNTTVRIDALGMSVRIPDDMIVFTKDFDTNNTNLKALGIDEESLENYFKSEGGILFAVTPDFVMTLDIYSEIDVNSCSIRDLYRLSDAEFIAASDRILTVYEEYGYSDIAHDIYDQHQTKFEIMRYHDTAGGSSYLKAYTVVDLRHVYLAFRFYNQKMTKAQQETCLGVIDSISFDTYANENHAKYYAGIQKTDADTVQATGGNAETSSLSTTAAYALAIILFVIVIGFRRRKRSRAAVNDPNTLHHNDRDGPDGGNP